MQATACHIGQRVSCKRSYLGAQYLQNQPHDEVITATCEAYCPSTQSYLIVFDDPFETLQPTNNVVRPRKGISIAILDTDDYLLYEDWPQSGNIGFGGNTTIKTSKAKQLACAWFAKWVSANEFSKRLKEEKDEPLLCLCRRLETAEPPPPNTRRVDDNNDESDGDEDDAYAASKLIECDRCKEWFHSECVERICKIGKDGVFICPLCTGVLLPHGYRALPDSLDAKFLPRKRRGKWLEHSTAQPMWKNNSLLEWQYWTRAGDAAGENSMWVICMATFRRFVGSKLKKQCLGDSTGEGSEVRALRMLLTSELPTRVAPLEPIMASLAVTLQKPGTTPELPPALLIPVQRPSSSPPPVSVIAARSAPLPENFPMCTRIRTYDEHMLFAKTKRHKMKSHEVSASINSSIENLSSFGKKRHLRFAKSLIQGWGVFTEEFIPGGDFVIEYKGEIVTKAEAEIRFAKYTASGLPDYLFTMDSTSICDATMRGSMARFLNHSCDPNCYSTIVSHSGRKKIGIFALRDIRVGEELCYDYKFQEDADVNNKIKCNCGAKNCRGVLN